MEMRENTESLDENIEYTELIRIVVKYFSPEQNWDNLFVDTSITESLKIALDSQ